MKRHSPLVRMSFLVALCAFLPPWFYQGAWLELALRVSCLGTIGWAVVVVAALSLDWKRNLPALEATPLALWWPFSMVMLLADCALYGHCA